jgi:4-amino-4-deoxy-L-arabinose transferase-like glycosyltransferase
MRDDTKTLIWVAVIVAAARLLSLPFDILYDTTEARYAEIARRMAETGNFITPYISGTAPMRIPGVLADSYPFWAKPPLSFWIGALSIMAFGVNEFAVKLPSFLFLGASAIIMWAFVRRDKGEAAAALALAVLSTMSMVVFYAGGVMTDPSLVFCLTLAMASLYNAMRQGKNRGPGELPAAESARRPRRKPAAGYLVFAALGLGLLAKGPLILVVFGLPLFFYTAVKKKRREMFRALPWLGGPAIMLAVAAPWYILAERATPGFINYFFVGEHFERYITPEWTGDMYGTGRGGFTGQIWLCFLAVVMPWPAFAAIAAFFKNFRKRISEAGFFRDDFLFYSLCFAAAPLVFFTMSKNIVVTYALLSAIPAAIVLAAAVPADTRLFKCFAAMNIVALIGFIAVPAWKPSEKFNIENARGKQVYYLNRDVPYSAMIYSGGRAARLDDIRAADPGDIIMIRAGRGEYRVKAAE